MHLAKEFVEDLKFVKARPAASVALRRSWESFALTPPLPRSAVVQDENADMLRETLQYSLKLPSMEDSGDTDDDGRPLVKKTP